MNILIQVGLLAVGFVCLVKGADVFVGGSSALARNFNVPGLIIGLTIVALGTSAPEMAVSTVAALQGANEIALSNVVGSNIFNLLGVLGVCAVISPLPVDGIVLKRDFPFAILTTIIVLFISCGSVLFGGHFIGYSAKEIARAAGMTETLIGLTIVAIGTSLPELVTSAVAARKGETGMAIGNVIGSNIFNLLFILGVSALIHPVAINMASVYDLIILVGVSIISLSFAFTSRKISRMEGGFMLLIYAVDVMFAIVR